MLRRKPSLRVVFVVGYAAASLVWRTAEANPPPAVGQTPADVPALGDLARSVIHKRMMNHRADMQELTLAAVLLQYPKAAAAATRIANEPRLVRPIAGGENDVNAAIPERLFVLQDELRLKAQALAAAAEKKDDAALARSYAELSGTCIGCHSSFLDRAGKK